MPKPKKPPATEPAPVTFRAKVLELDGSHEDKLLRVAFDGKVMAIAGGFAPFLFEEVEITIRKVPNA